MEAGATGHEEHGIKGLLVSLLTLFDTNRTNSLSKEEYLQAAAPLGFDISDAAWMALCARFGDKTSKEMKAVHDGREDLDLNLLGSYFANKYDKLLEEVLRRLLKGIINTNARETALEKRVKKMEEHLETALTQQERERQHKIAKTLRQWRNTCASAARAPHTRVLSRG